MVERSRKPFSCAKAPEDRNASDKPSIRIFLRISFAPCFAIAGWPALQSDAIDRNKRPRERQGNVPLRFTHWVTHPMGLLTCTKEQHGDPVVVWRGSNLWSGCGHDCARNVAATSRGSTPHADSRVAVGLAEE